MRIFDPSTREDALPPTPFSLVRALTPKVNATKGKHRKQNTTKTTDKKRGQQQQAEKNATKRAKNKGSTERTTLPCALTSLSTHTNTCLNLGNTHAHPTRTYTKTIDTERNYGHKHTKSLDTNRNHGHTCTIKDEPTETMIAHMASGSLTKPSLSLILKGVINEGKSSQIDHVGVKGQECK